jgi:hypothetical protein
LWPFRSLQRAGAALLPTPWLAVELQLGGLVAAAPLTMCMQAIARERSACCWARSCPSWTPSQGSMWQVPGAVRHNLLPVDIPMRACAVDLPALAAHMPAHRLAHRQAHMCTLLTGRPCVPPCALCAAP